MKTFLTLAVTLCAATLASAEVFDRVGCNSSVAGDIYGFSAVPVNMTAAERITFDTYQDMVVLVVPVASYSTLSTQAFLELNSLMTQYAADPFIVLPFHTTEFHRETPMNNDEILNMLFYVRPGNGYVPLFPVFQKSYVNGETEDGLFTFLKSACPYTDDDYRTDVEYSPIKVSDFRGPFEKILVGRDGKPYYRYHTTTDISQISDDIASLLVAA